MIILTFLFPISRINYLIATMSIAYIAMKVDKSQPVCKSYPVVFMVQQAPLTPYTYAYQNITAFLKLKAFKILVNPVCVLML